MIFRLSVAFFALLIAAAQAEPALRTGCTRLLSQERMLALEAASRTASAVADTADLDVPSGILVFRAGPEKTSDAFLYGRIERFELVPGYHVLRVSTPGGAVHLIDPERAEIRSILAPTPDAIAGLEQQLARDVDPPIFVLDEPRVKRRFCAKLARAKNDPELRRLREAVDSKFKKDALLSARDVLRQRCIGGVMAAWILQGASLASRAVTPSGTWVHDHSSNFVYSVGYMAALDQCLQALAPGRRASMLALVLGASVAGNTWEEVEIPGVDNHSLPIFNSGGKKVRTDLADWKAGAAGSVAYVVGVKALESYLPGFAFWNYCD